MVINSIGVSAPSNQDSELPLDQQAASGVASPTMGVDQIAQSRESPDVMSSYRSAASAMSSHWAPAPPSTTASSNDVAGMNLAQKVETTAKSGIAAAASDAGGAAGKFLRDPKNDALLVGGTAAVAGAQLIPGVDVAVDVGLGVVGAAMYASAAPEHRANITAALGHLKSYAGEVGQAKTQADLDRASNDFAQFLKLGGTEAAEALGALAGAAAGGSKLAGLAQKVKDVGGLDGVVAAASCGAKSAAQGAGSALTSAEGWLSDALGIRGPEVDAAGIGKLDARMAPASVRPLGSGARADGVSSANGSTALEQRAVLSGKDPNTLTGLNANAVYEFSGGYRYLTDEQGRVSEIHATLRNQPGERSQTLQSAAGGLSRLQTDEGGHLVAVRFNGPAHEVNHIAQDIKLNRGQWRVLENQWAKELDQGKQVDVKIKLTYPNDSQRPSKIRVQSEVDGAQPETMLFRNEAG